MERIPFCETDSPPADQEFPRLLWNAKFLGRVQAVAYTTQVNSSQNPHALFM
jgi:hypothetical protein